MITKKELIEKLESLERLRFVGDKLDHFEREIRGKLTFKQSKTLNIIYKEIWDYAHEIGELKNQIKSLAEGQPEVDEEFVEKWIDETELMLWEKTKRSDRRNFLRKRALKLIEAGVKIIKK